MTGGIAMGKSFVTETLRALDVPVLDSDATVHELYAPGGAAARLLGDLFGDDVIDEVGGVNRSALGEKVLGDAEDKRENMRRLESIVHPLVDARRAAFLDEAASSPENHKLVVLDIPLLFEKGYEDACDAVMVVSAGRALQRARCLMRENMTPEKFESILARQVPDDEKLERADVVIDTSREKAETVEQVERLVKDIREGRTKWEPRWWKSKEKDRSLRR